MRRVLVTGIAVAALAARADHTHVLILPNGKCRSTAGTRCTCWCTWACPVPTDASP